MKITVEPLSPYQTHLPTPSPNPPPQLDLSHNPTFPRKQPRRKPKIFAAGVRVKKEASKRGSRPETPLLGWKFDETRSKNKSVEEEEEEADDEEVKEKEQYSTEPCRKSGRKIRPVVSARKLAGGLWRLHLPEFETRNGLQPGDGGVGTPGRDYRVDRKHGSPANNLVHNPLYVSVTKAGFQHKGSQFEPSLQFPNPAMEGATKWDPEGGKTLDEPRHVFGRRKLPNGRTSDAPLKSALERQLEQARVRINELETERVSAKNNLEQFLLRISKERAEWRSREHEKIRAILDDMKAELSREKKNRHRLEILNSKLVNELADAKVSVKRALQEYEKERKARELTEEVCDELAKEIGEDKAEAETLKRESRKILEEVEEERKMLQMAEVWREERVQMKLVDAKVMLEERYSYMNRILAELDDFLNSQSTKFDSEDMKKLELLREVAASINIQDVRELKYEPPNPDDMFSAFEDINFGQSNEHEIEPDTGCSTASCDSKFHLVTPEIMVPSKDCGDRHSSIYMHCSNELEEDASEWETVSHPEDQGSSYSPDESDPSVNKSFRETPTTEISDVSYVQQGKFKRGLSISRLWRSHTSNGDDSYKVASVEGVNQRFSNGRISNGAMMSTPDCGSGKGEHSPQDLAGRWSLHDPRDSHLTRGMKGCIEWPRSSHRSSLKARLLEARMDGQKIQLRQALKQKI